MLVFRPTETRHRHAATLSDANATIENPKKNARTTTTIRDTDTPPGSRTRPPRRHDHRHASTHNDAPRRAPPATRHTATSTHHTHGTCTAPHIHDPRAPAPRHTSRYGQQSPRHASRSTSVQHDTQQRIDHQTTRTTSHPLPPQYKQGNTEPPRPQ